MGIVIKELQDRAAQDEFVYRLELAEFELKSLKTELQELYDRLEELKK